MQIDGPTAGDPPTTGHPPELDGILRGREWFPSPHAAAHEAIIAVPMPVPGPSGVAVLHANCVRRERVFPSNSREPSTNSGNKMRLCAASGSRPWPGLPLIRAQEAWSADIWRCDTPASRQRRLPAR